jgi:hypothetical protein
MAGQAAGSDGPSDSNQSVRVSQLITCQTIRCCTLSPVMSWTSCGTADFWSPSGGQTAQVTTGAPVGPVLSFSEAEWIAFLEDADSFRGERI